MEFLKLLVQEAPSLAKWISVAHFTLAVEELADLVWTLWLERDKLKAAAAVQTTHIPGIYTPLLQPITVP